MGNSHKNLLVWNHLPSPNTILEGGHPRIIPPVLLQLAQWFLRRRFLCEFPIGSYVKLSSAVGAILVEGPNRRTHFWKRTIQWLFHQNFVVIEQMVSDKKIFMGISHRVLCWINFGCCISIIMSFLTNITGFFMNFELLPILTDYAN
jgi:hypothetical protein